MKKNKIIILISIIVLIVIIIILCLNNIKVGTIKDGKVEYIDRIKNVTKYENKILIEFDNNQELIDNCIMTTELYNDFKNNNKDIYNLTLKDYIKLSSLTAKESYNIHKSIDLKLVNENTKYTDYFAITCGFKNKRELLKYTASVIKLANKVD